MQEESIIKKVFIKIKKFFLVLFLIIGNFIRWLFGKDKKNISQAENQDKKQLQAKQESPISNQTTILPDEDNIKVNPHNNVSNQEDTTNNTDVVLEIPKQKLYKVYTKDNELKYLPLDALLNLIIKEELERIYKIEKFKLKTASTKELIAVEHIKERVLPEIITRVENDTLRNAEVIRKEVLIKLEEDLLKNPLFPPRPTPTEKKEDRNIYSLAFPKKKDIILNDIELPKIKNSKSNTITSSKKDELVNKLDSTNVMMVQNIEEIPKPTLADNLKDATVIGTVSVAAVASEILSQPKNEDKKNDKEATKEEDISLPQPAIEAKEDSKQLEIIEEQLIKEATKITEQDQKQLDELEQQLTKEVEKIKEEQSKQESPEKKEEPPKEEKPQVKEEVKQETKEKEKQKEEQEKKQEEKAKQAIEEEQSKKSELEVIAVTTLSEKAIAESKDEINKDDFFEKDYERIERQIDKMLDDLTNTYLKYDGKLSEKQKKKLKAEENRLRETKEKIRTQKDYDIQTEQRQLDETIKQSELDGLEFELEKLHKENQAEVSNDLLGKIARLEGMTGKQVANVDKRIMLKRFNKANILLEMSSLLALPFIRNKYFFYFTIGLVIDNHFNFVNAFFNRKYNRYNPVDLSQIKQGQDALNGALDITYKNLVELDYLEQRALAKYPDLSYDPRFINQVTKLRTNLNKKYNNLMKKNKTLEKYRMKTKKQRKILKPELEPPKQEAA